MPLQHLVDYFNQRFIEEQGFTRPPLNLKDRVVEGHCDGVWFGSILQPVHAHANVSRIIAHDAALQVVDAPASVGSLPELLSALGSGSTHDSILTLSRWRGNEIADQTVVHLDRLSRTVHMLNFLVFSHEVRSLFLHVHPRHILAVEKEHGAYFEEIILRCGLSPQRIVITLPVNRNYSGQTALLLNRLRNYRDRGYATALKFEDRLDEHRYLDFLNQFTPDFVRFDWSLLQNLLKTADAKRNRETALLSRIRQQDTQLLVEGIRTADDAGRVAELHPDAVKGEYYRQIIASERNPQARTSLSKISLT